MSTKNRTATEWVEDVNDMLLTWSPNPADILTFAVEHGAIAGRYVASTGPNSVTVEDGWTARHDGQRFILAA